MTSAVTDPVGGRRSGGYPWGNPFPWIHHLELNEAFWTRVLKIWCRNMFMPFRKVLPTNSASLYCSYQIYILTIHIFMLLALSSLPQFIQDPIHVGIDPRNLWWEYLGTHPSSYQRPSFWLCYRVNGSSGVLQVNCLPHLIHILSLDLQHQQVCVCVEVLCLLSVDALEMIVPIIQQ